MADYGWPGYGEDYDGDYQGGGAVQTADERQDPDFDIPFEASSFAAFWALLLVQAALGLIPLFRGQAGMLKRWPLYWMMINYLVSTCACESLALTFSLSIKSKSKEDGQDRFKGVYYAYIFFWHMSSASFLMLLLALSSGYNITRNTLQGHKGKVICIPAIVFIAGVVSDYTFLYIVATQPLSTAADRYDVVEMTPWETAVWSIGSIANIMCFILAWVYIFDSIQMEIKDLDDAQEAFKVAVSTSTNRLPPPGSGPRAGLLQGLPSSTSPDIEQANQRESVADRVEYTQRKKLLSTFYYGVCGYLIASILIILLPVFFFDVVQNVLTVLQLVVKWCFTAVLMWIFRPARDELYLQIGVSENDAEEQGLSQLDTELTVTEPSSGRTGSNPRPANGPARGLSSGVTQAAPPSGLPVSSGAGSKPTSPKFTIADDD